MMKCAKESIDLGLIVKDIESSLKFYRDLLGLKYIETIPARFGMLYRLRWGTSDFKLVDPKEMPPNGLTGLQNQIGFRYVTFSVQNLSEVCAELTRSGVEFELPEREIRPGTRIAMVKDPDGNTVEFVQRG